MRAQVFGGVTVGLPSKVRGSEAEEEWQELDWVKWSTGDLEVSPDGFLLVFKPSGAPGAVKPKPLGSLLRGSPVAQESRTITITTSDSVHRHYRLTFADDSSAAAFSALAADAQAAHEQAESFEGDAGAVGAAAEEMRLLQAEACEALEKQGRWPLAFAGAELMGPDPGGDAGSEALLGRGLMVLLDPPEEAAGPAAGKYEVLFYSTDQGPEEPVKRLVIGPRTSVKRVPSDTGALLLDEGLPGVCANTVSFDCRATAAGFLRDLRVRQRLMDVSLKTVKSRREAGELRAEVAEMHQRRSWARLAGNWSLRALLVVLLLAAARLVMLFLADQGVGGTRSLSEHVAVLQQEAQSTGRLAWSGAATAGAQACRLACGAAGASSSAETCRKN